LTRAAADLLGEHSGGHQRAAAIGGGEAERRDAGELPPGDRAEHHDAFGAIDRGRRQQPWARIPLTVPRSVQTDPEHDLANGDHPDEPVGRPSPRAGIAVLLDGVWILLVSVFMWRTPQPAAP
jgi:hypothetical protein